MNEVNVITHPVELGVLHSCRFVARPAKVTKPFETEFGMCTKMYMSYQRICNILMLYSSQAYILCLYFEIAVVQCIIV